MLKFNLSCSFFKLFVVVKMGKASRVEHQTKAYKRRSGYCGNKKKKVNIEETMISLLKALLVPTVTELIKSATSRKIKPIVCYTTKSQLIT